MRGLRRRTGRALRLAAAVALTATAWGSAEELSAQIALGAQVSSGDNSGFGIGPRVVLDLGPFDAGLRLVGSFDLFFPGDDFTYADTSLRDLRRADVATDGIDQDYWEANLDVVYSLGPPLVPLRPYVGGGLNFAHVKRTGSPGEIIDVDKTDRGINLRAGLEVDVGSVSPFVEARLTFKGGDQLVITGGIVF